MIFGGIRASEEPKGKSKTKIKSAIIEKEERNNLGVYPTRKGDKRNKRARKRRRLPDISKKPQKQKQFRHLITSAAKSPLWPSQPANPGFLSSVWWPVLDRSSSGYFPQCWPNSLRKWKEERRIVVLLQPLCLRKMPRRCVVISLPRMVCVMNRRETWLNLGQIFVGFLLLINWFRERVLNHQKRKLASWKMPCLFRI